MIVFPSPAFLRFLLAMTEKDRKNMMNDGDDGDDWTRRRVLNQYKRGDKHDQDHMDNEIICCLILLFRQLRKSLWYEKKTRKNAEWRDYY